MSQLGKRSSYTNAGGSSTATDGVGVGVGGVLEDFNLSLLYDGGSGINNIPISDAEIAENLGFQEALMGSFKKLKQTQIIRSEVKTEQNLDDTTATTTTSTATPSRRPMNRVKPEPMEVVKPELADGFCGICKEMKRMGEMFIRRGTSASKCSHTFCFECMRKHIAARIQENEIVIKCPDLECQEVLEPHTCQGLVPKEIFDRWGDAMSESLFSASVKIYCPYGDCDGMLVNDGGDAIRETECLHCRRMFCAQCKVPWHSNVNCEDYQKVAGLPAEA